MARGKREGVGGEFSVLSEYLMESIFIVQRYSLSYSQANFGLPKLRFSLQK